jgi:alanyl-tRNA synthetase
MEKFTAAQIRERYLRFFERHGHTIVPSSSLLVPDDPTLLFANSGMVQFKNLFLGLEQRPYQRATTTQKCLRVSGKHNDLEEVGPSPRHHTFFEMLGNFSFGDYFKAEAIPFAWELLTREFQLPVERLWFTIFEGNDRVPADEEAARLWQQAGAPPERILRFGEKDNFWVMADTGPCGPCSEITIYIGDDLDKMNAAGVNSDDPDYVEIWNLVFMQFERSTMQPLPRPSVDTGMGLERMAMVLQGVHSTYETDLFTPVIDRTMALLGSDEAHYRAHLGNYRAIADHARAVAFLIADGVLPGNSRRSYVLRRILRRAVYQGHKIGFERPFLAEVVDRVIAEMGAAYPALQQRRDFILEAVNTEEQQFLRTLAEGLTRLDGIIAQVKTADERVIPGDDAFRLKDTYGFPFDLTQKIAAEQDLDVDESGYEAKMAEQRKRSREAAQFKRGVDVDIWVDRDLPPTEFIGYTELESRSRILALVTEGDDVSAVQAGQTVQVVLDRTPFYAESGGQVGDAGTLSGPNGRILIEDTQRPVPGLIVHYGLVEDGQVAQGETVTARVNRQRRHDIQRNHTATHLLHRALRDVLGEHAAQAGSLVAPDRLRFDFTHTRGLAPEQLHDIERRINDWVRADGTVVWEITDYQGALDRGAIALFGEKYGDQVRMVHIARGDGAVETVEPVEPYEAFAGRDSIELCGGTHVNRTGEIGLVRVVSEGSVGSGIRRVEALTGRGAQEWVNSQVGLLHDLAARLSVPPAQLTERIEALLAENRRHQQELDALRSRQTRGTLEQLLGQVQQENGVALVTARVEATDATHLREMGDWLRDKLGSGIVVLGTVMGEKPQLISMVTPDLVKQGYHAGNLVKALAQVVGGGGGGRPDMAQAGGRDVTKLDEALARVAGLVAEQGKK